MLLEGEQENKTGRDRELAAMLDFDPDNPGEVTDMFDAQGNLIIRN